MANQKIWQYADDYEKDTSSWAVTMAGKYHTYIGIGYLDKENGDYYERYMIVGPDSFYGTVTKSEGDCFLSMRTKHLQMVETLLWIQLWIIYFVMGMLFSIRQSI